MLTEQELKRFAEVAPDDWGAAFNYDCSVLWIRPEIGLEMSLPHTGAERVARNGG